MKLDDLTLDEDKMKFSDVLNQDIWENDTLKPKVYNKLKEIADAFIEYLDIDMDIVDIQFTGSMANYNFNSDSDIDLHIIANFSKYGIDSDLLQDYFNAKKTIFNSNHNINIYGHPVELYVEDSTKPAQSGGKYSILKDKWLIKPQKITVEVEDVIDSPKYLELVNKIMDVLSSEYNSEEAKDVLNNLYVMRKQGLSSGGELSEENLIFKKLRSNGYIQDLRTYINVNYDKTLSLNESYESDVKYRAWAVQLALIAKKAINASFEKYPLLISEDGDLYIEITSDVLKLDKFFIGKQYYLRFSSAQLEWAYSFTTTTDKTKYFVSFPILPDTAIEYLTQTYQKHPKETENICAKYDFNVKNPKCSQEIYDMALKYVKKDIQKNTKEFFINELNVLIHEFTHLIDSLRRSKTYKPQEQSFNSEEDYKNYYNSAIEQNAYYQETVYLFDEWKNSINNKKYWQKSFMNFYLDFKNQYRGEIKYLNSENLLKLKKRIYTYWRKNFSTPKYEDIKL